MSYIGNEPIVSATRTITEVTATAGQTVFTANGGYTVGYIDVFLNGAQLQTVDFTATNGTTITLTEAAQVGDVLKLVAWGTFLTSNGVVKTGDTMTGDLTLNNGSTDGAQLVLASSGYDNWNLDNFNGRFRAYNGSTERMTIDASGNVGIGTASPTRRLVAQQTSVGEVARLVTTAGGAGATTGTVSLGFDVFGGQTNPFASIEVGEDESSPAGTYRSRMSFYTRSVDSDSAPAERMRITNAGLLQFNSGYGSVATAYGCRAWVNFNGTGTVAIRASGNVSSITDNGTGDYTVNFTNAMPDANYTTCFAGGQRLTHWGIYLGNSSYGSTTGSHRFGVTTPSDTLTDTIFCSLAFFR